MAESLLGLDLWHFASSQCRYIATCREASRTRAQETHLRTSLRLTRAVTHFRICSHCIVYHSVDVYELVDADDDDDVDDDADNDVDVEPTYSERLFDFVQVLIVDVDGFADNYCVDVIAVVVFGG